jgi:ERCC4-type nuclease
MLESSFTALIDTREQTPLDLSPFKVKKETLDTGDYSIQGLTEYIRIERKSLQDLVMCVGRERKRFEKEISRLKAYETRAVVVEARWEDLVKGKWRGNVTSAQVIGSVLGWVASGIPILTPGKDIAPVVKKIMHIAARRKYYSFSLLTK